MNIRPLNLLAAAVLALPVAGCSVLGQSSNVHTDMVIHPEGAVTQADLATAREIITKRANSNGLTGTVTENSDGTLKVSVKGEVPKEEMTALATPGLLRFRKVLDIGDPAMSPVKCTELASRPAEAITKPSLPVTMCDQSAIYRLDVAKLSNADIASAKVAESSGMQTVLVSFTESGAAKWTDLTREAFTNSGGGCTQVALGGGGKCRIAIVRDKEIISAPEILGVLTSQAAISGNFSKAAANALARQLSGGELPVSFTFGDVTVVRG